MLLSFSVENSGAFRDPQEFSLRRVKNHGERDDASDWDPSVSVVAAVYGANASGKSTLVRSLAFLCGAVSESYTQWPVGRGTRINPPFLLDPEHASRPSSFEIEVRANDGLDYQYGFAMDAEAVRTEWLYVYRTARRTLLFRRDGNSLKFGPAFRGARGLAEATLTRPNALTLSVAAQLGNPQVMPAFTTITTGIGIYDAHRHRLGRPAVVQLATERPDDLRDVIELVRNADLGITDMSVATLTDEGESRLRHDLANEGMTPSEVDDTVKRSRQRLLLAHTGAEGSTSLPLEFESEGTQALLSFAPVVLRALAEGSTVVIDEVDTSLHPAMVRALVELFVSPANNPKQAQLIVTTHDTTLLGANMFGQVLHRDQVWLTEKDPQSGAAELVAVAEYSPRKNENLERGYLTGRYGGVPHLPTSLVSLSGQ